MKLTPDAKRRVVLPLPIQKGDILLLDEQGANRWLLTRVERPKPVSLRKLRGKSVAEVLAGSFGTEAQIREHKTELLRKVKL